MKTVDHIQAQTLSLTILSFRRALRAATPIMSSADSVHEHHERASQQEQVRLPPKQVGAVFCYEEESSNT